MDGALNKIERDYWNNRYARGSTSGDGSYGEKLEEKLRWLSGITEIDSISEYGCGDFNFGKRLVEMFKPKKYTGMDVSSIIIERNQEAYPEHEWLPVGDLPQADLVLCVDVLFHVSNEDEVEKILQQLERAWVRYLVITAYEREQTEKLSPHVYIRPFDPARFGTPLVRKETMGDENLYFYIFSR